MSVKKTQKENLSVVEKTLTISALVGTTEKKLINFVGDKVYEAYKELLQREKIDINCLKEEKGFVFEVEIFKEFKYDSRSHYRGGDSFEKFHTSDVFYCIIEESGRIRLSQGAEVDSLIALCFLYFTIKQDPTIHCALKQEISDVLKTLYEERFKEPLVCESVVISHNSFTEKAFNLDVKSKLFKKRVKDDSLNLRFMPGARVDKERIYQSFKNQSELEQIHFCFNNGVALSIREVLLHPYSWIIEDYIKDFITNLDRFDKVNSYRWEKSDESDDRSSSQFIEALEAIVESRKVLPIYLGQANKREVLVWPSFRVESVNYSTKTVEAQLRPLLKNSISGEINLEFIRTNNRDKKGSEIKFSHIIYSPEDGQLTIEEENRSETRIIQSIESDFEIKGAEVDAGSEQVTLVNHPNIKKLDELFNVNKVSFNKEGIEPIADLTSELEVLLSSQDMLSLRVDIKTQVQEKYWFINGHRPQLKDFVRSINKGLSYYYFMSSRDLATNNPKLRNAELKLYKHSGLILFILSECLVYKDNVTNKDNKAFVISLMDKVAIVCHTIVNKKPPEGEYTAQMLKNNLVSIKLLGRLKSFIEEFLILIDEKQYLVTGGEVSRVNVGMAHQKLFELIVSIQLDASTKGLGFLKSKFPDFYLKLNDSKEKFVAFSGNKEASYINIKFEEEIPVKSLLMIPNIKVDGASIEEIAPQDLTSQMSIRGQDKIDWFELHPQYFFRGEEIPLNVAQKFINGELVEYRGKFFRVDPKEIPSLKRLTRFWEKIQKMGDKTGGWQLKDSHAVKVERSQVLELLALKRSGVPILGDEKWANISRAFDDLESNQEIYRSTLLKGLESFNGELKPFQIEGLLWFYNLYQLGLGGILSDDMGLGKTVQSIAMFRCLQLEKKLGLCLVVVPTSLVYNWREEIKKFGPSLEVDFFESAKKDQFKEEYDKSSEKIVICTYGVFFENIDFLNEFNWNITLFDEAQNLKNIKSKRRMAAYNLKSKNKFALTGTPLENHFGELYSILDICLPGSLGSYQAFMSAFRFVGFMTDSNRVEDIEFLKMKIKPLVLRRTKAKVLNDLPDKIESVVPIAFDKKQEKIYKDIALSWNNQIEQTVRERGESGAQLQMLTALLRLRQICSCPQSVPNVVYNQVSPKIELVQEKIEELCEKGESTIVFTNFLFTLEFLKENLKKTGVQVWSLCGADSRKKRELTLKEFNDSSEGGCLIMTLKTGGVGLNLTKANYVFHLEPWWNPAVENQGTDRVYRIGQEKTVNVYRYIMKNSVEEKIQLLKQKKQYAFDAIFSENSEGIEENVRLSGSQLSKKDFDALLT